MSRSSRRAKKQRVKPPAPARRPVLRVETLEDRVVPYSTPISGPVGAITDNAASTFDLVITDHFDVQDINLTLSLTHGDLKELKATLEKVGTGTTVTLFDNLTGADLTGM